MKRKLAQFEDGRVALIEASDELTITLQGATESDVSSFSAKELRKNLKNHGKLKELVGEKLHARQDNVRRLD